MPNILAIESSCDETAAAVVRSGEEVLSSVVASQIATHQPYGGVVPELASREHLRAVVTVVRQALAEIGYTGWCTAEVSGGGRDVLADIAQRMDRVLLL